MNRVHIPRPLKILTAFYVAYLALVLLIATPLLNIFAPKIYREQTGRELQLGKIIWLNPFTLALTVHDASSAANTSSSQNKADDPSRLWSFDKLTANVSLASVWRGHLVLDALELHGLYLQIDQTAPDRFNFSDILDYRAKHFPAEPTTTTENTQQENKPFAIEIDQLVFSAIHLGYHASHSAEPLNVSVSNFDFALTNFSTASEKNATTQSTVAVPATTLPSLRGDHVQFTLKTLAVDFLREQHPFTTTLHDVKIATPTFATTVNSDYEISLRDSSGGSVQIKGSAALARHNTTGSAQIRGLNLIPAWQYLADKLAFEAQHAQLDGDINYRVSWGEQLAYQVQNSRLALRNVQLQSRADTDTSATFNALRVEGIAVDSAQPQVSVAQVTLEQPVLRGWNRDTKVSLLDMIYFPSSEEQSESPPWQVRVDTIDVADGTLHWHANQLDNRQLTVMPLALHATNLHWPDPAPLQFNLAAIINDDTHADVGSKHDDLKVAFDGELVPGDVTGKINGSIANLPLAWGNTLVLQQIHASIADGTLTAKFAVKLDKAQPTLVTSDGSVDQFELQTQTLSKQPLADRRKLVAWKKMEWRQLELNPTQRRAAIKQIVATQPWAQFRIDTDGTTNFQQLMVQPTSSPVTSKNNAAATATAEKHKAAPSEKPWQYAIDNIHIDNATINFRDASLTSSFRTDIATLSGDIDGLNSTGPNSSQNKPAKVGLRGTVDGYAPVALTGTVDPFAAKPTLDVALDITNLDLATLTPYSGTYAGYQIDSGRLTVQITYKMQDGRIKGTNHIIVNQMQLGKQVSGPKVMDLPLRFAIYLLTDADGVMDLGVDVAGDVNDPDFSVGSIVWKAFRNLIVKTVTSPFRALANLAGAGARDDLNRIEFPAGSDQIAASETEKLQTLNTALQKKPALKLSITGHVSPNHDIEALRDNTLTQQLIAQGGINQTDFQQQSKNWQREVVKLFKRRFPEEDTAHWQVMQMNDAMRDNIELETGALQDLAAHRALAVKQLLVTDIGLAAERALVKPADLGADKNPGLQATMEVE